MRRYGWGTRARLVTPPEATEAWRTFYLRLRERRTPSGRPPRSAWPHDRAPSGAVSYDGEGTLIVAPYDEMDADDHLAQIVTHELAHLAVQGPSSKREVDWGLDNMSDAHVPRELAALRVQASWCDLHGLRDVLVPTTAFRAAWPGIGAAPFDPPGAGLPEPIEGTRITAQMRQEAAALAHGAELRESLGDAIHDALAQTAHASRALLRDSM